MKKTIITLIFVLIFIISINYNTVIAVDEEENLVIEENTTNTENTIDEQPEEEPVYNDIKGEQSAEDGTYTIISVLNKNKFFEIENGSTSNGAKLQIYDSNKTIQQKFIVEYSGDGFYKIKSKKSNKVLTIESNEPSIGSSITQEDDENLDTQKWILKKYSEGVYEIISKCGNLYINLESTNNEQELELTEKNESNNQKFLFVNLTPKKDIAHINNGIYQIALSTGKVLDVYRSSCNNKANIQIYSNSKGQNQKFRVARIGKTDYYKITSINSAKPIDVDGAQEAPGTNLQQYQSNNTDSQSWLLKNAGNGYYYIISKANGLCLDVFGGKTNINGTNVRMYYNYKGDCQKFKFIPINIINNNTYEIETKLSSNRIVDIKGASKSNGTRAQIWRHNNVNQQRFIITALSANTYKIIAKHSNKALTVNKKNNDVIQSTYTGAKTQQWQVVEKGNGYYSLVCKANGLSLGVYQDKTTKGQKLKVYVSNKTNSRQFKFVTGFRKFYEEGTYGKSGLKIKGDSRGTKLKYYKIGKGSKSFFATFSIHGFEDSFDHDGKELTYIAEEFKNYVKNNITESIVNKYTIYIFPCLNPDGQYYGYTNDGPGRTTLYSKAPNHKGIDMNRNWSVEFTKQKGDRNYNGTKAFQAYEAKYLRDFILEHEGKSNILVDTHGWLNETMGDKALGKYYSKQFGFTKHIDSYGRGYLINWARTLKKGKSTLVELPEVKEHSQVVNRNYAQKWINATMKMLKEN